MYIRMDTQPDSKPVQLQLGHICIRTETRCGAHTFYDRYRVSHSSKLWKQPKRPLKGGCMRKMWRYTEWARCSVATKGT